MRYRKFICNVCGHVYDEALGDEAAGLAAATRWEDILEDWMCPVCGATKGDFTLVEAEAAVS